MKSYIKLFLLGFIIFINSVCLFAGVWSPYTGISLTGSYSRFATAGSYVFYSASFSDYDKRTDGNNVTTISDSLDYNNNPSETLWSCGIDLNNKTKSSSYSSLSGIVPANQSAGDYNVSITANDLALIYNDDDTGSRNDSPVTKQVTTTIINLSLICSTNATYTNNNITYPLRITPLNDDDDNGNGIKDNQETQSVQGENDLVPITFTPLPVNDSTKPYCKVRISFSGVRVFASSDRSNEISNNTIYNLSEFENHSDKTVYAEPMGMGVGNVTVSMYSNFTGSDEGEDFHSITEANISKTVYIAAASVDVTGANINDNNEMTEPGYVIGKYDELNLGTGTLNLSQMVPNQITDYSVKITKSNNNVKLFYYTYDQNTFTQIENEITNETVFNKGAIPNNIMVKGLTTGETVVTASLNITELNGESYVVDNFHTDSMKINTVETDIYSDYTTNENENTNPGFVLGLNNSNIVDYDLNNINENYTGYKVSWSIPSNLNVYTDAAMTVPLNYNYIIGTDTLPEHLYLFGKNSGSGQFSLNFYSPNNSLIHKDTMTVNVIYCDLALDSNNDNTITQTLNGADDSIEATYPGKYIPCNTDDDDGDGIIDNNDEMIVPVMNSGYASMGENDMREIKLSSFIFSSYMGPNTNLYTGYSAVLTYSDNIKLYGSSQKATGTYNNGQTVWTGNYVPSNTAWTVGTATPPGSLYIEGTENGQGYIEFTIYDTNNREIYRDRVVVTVEPIIDTVEFISPEINDTIGGIIPIKIKRIQRYGNSTGVLKVKETGEDIYETDHPSVDWVNIPTNETGSFVMESKVQNPENRTTETIYRYKWNTITTPMPNYGNGVMPGMGMIGSQYQTHNGQHTLRYEQTIGALPKVNTDLNVNLNNLTISTDSDILVWKGLDEDNNPIETPTINLTVNDNDTNDPYNVEVKIYHTGAEYSGTTNYNGQSQWTPVKTITLTNCTGSTQTITWDGSVDSGVSAQNAYSHDRYNEEFEALTGNTGSGLPNPLITVPAPTVAEPWTYTYDITVTQNDTETYTFPNQSQATTWSSNDTTWLRSKYLSIQRAKDENNKYVYDLDFLSICSENNSNHRYLYKDFILKDSLNINAQSLTIQLYDFTDNYPIYTVNPTYCEKHAENDLKSSSNIAHSTILEIPKECITTNEAMSSPLIAEDNHGLKYRNHNTKNCIALNQAKEKKQALWLIEIPDKLPDYGEEYEINISARDIYDISHIYENAKENFEIEVESSRYTGVCGNKLESHITGENSATNILSKDFQVIGLKINNIDYEPITDDLRDSSASDKWTKNVSGYKNGIISLKLKSYDYGGNAKIKITPERDNDLVVYTNSLDNELQNIIYNYYNYDYLLSSNIHYILQRNNDNKIAYCPWDFDNDGMADSWELTEYNSEANYEKNTTLTDYEKLYSIYPTIDNEISETRKNKIISLKNENSSLLNIPHYEKDNIPTICEYRGVILKDNTYKRLSPYKQEFFFSIERPNESNWQLALETLNTHISPNRIDCFDSNFTNSIPSSNTIISAIKEVTDYDEVYEIINDNLDYVIIYTEDHVMKKPKINIYLLYENINWSENSSDAYAYNNNIYFQIPRYYNELININYNYNNNNYNWNNIFLMILKHELGHVLGQVHDNPQNINIDPNSLYNYFHFFKHHFSLNFEGKAIHNQYLTPYCLMNENLWDIGPNVEYCPKCYINLNDE